MQLGHYTKADKWNTVCGERECVTCARQIESTVGRCQSDKI